ncbi:uncharacterized protein G2W53_040268 [Senna tora]|uniref:Uncharacterized protein n=1 Tax=Senna tora TaxID=362788 RepID=A0A834SQS7_9FABA|nr:uncharacterized protein G2W53_040268 [Senna tora]
MAEGGLAYYSDPSNFLLRQLKLDSCDSGLRSDPGVVLAFFGVPAFLTSTDGSGLLGFNGGRNVFFSILTAAVLYLRYSSLF